MLSFAGGEKSDDSKVFITEMTGMNTIGIYSLSNILEFDHYLHQYLNVTSILKYSLLLEIYVIGMLHTHCVICFKGFSWTK